MRKVLLSAAGVIALLALGTYWLLNSMTPTWVGTVCSNCELGPLRGLKYRLKYLRASARPDMEMYEDKWFRFEHFKGATVDIDEIDNRINIFGEITYATSSNAARSTYSEITVSGTVETTPDTLPELQKDNKGRLFLPGLPRYFFGEIIPRSYEKAKLPNGATAAVFIVKGRYSTSPDIRPFTKIYGYLIPAKNHLLIFSADLGCDPVMARQEIAAFYKVLTTFEIKSQWNWRAPFAVSGAKTQAQKTHELTNRLFDSMERRKLREEARKKAE